ncbi:hypothetical protein LINPERHAP1_LOCUS30326, partial [Linum perenne]
MLVVVEGRVAANPCEVHIREENIVRSTLVLVLSQEEALWIQKA